MNVIKIGIVDDLLSDRLLLINKIRSYMEVHGLIYHCYEYESAEDFLKNYRSMDFDIVFMDIYMKELSGIDAAAELRSYDRDCKLVFLTTSQEHIWQAVSFGICHYITKPIDDDNFQLAMKNSCVIPDHDVPVLSVISSGQSLHLDTSKILYIDRVGRSVMVHMTQKNLLVNGSFSNVTNPLIKDKRFLLCIQSTLINMDRVEEQSGGFFIMQNGDSVPINIRNKKTIQETFQNYLMRRMRGVI